MQTKTLNPDNYTYNYKQVALRSEFEEILREEILKEEALRREGMRVTPNVQWGYSDTYHVRAKAEANAWRKVPPLPQEVLDKLDFLQKQAEKLPVDSKWHHIKYGVYAKRSPGAEWRSMPRVGYWVDSPVLEWKENPA